MSTNIEERVKHVINYQLGVPLDDLKPGDKFVDDLGADSLDEVEIVMAIEDEFEIEISDEVAETIRTIQQAIDYIASRKDAR